MFCRDGEDEVLNSFLSEAAPEFKLTVAMAAGSVITAGALALCWFTGSDPRGRAK